MRDSRIEIFLKTFGENTVGAREGIEYNSMKYLVISSSTFLHKV